MAPIALRNKCLPLAIISTLFYPTLGFICNQKQIVHSRWSSPSVKSNDMTIRSMTMNVNNDPMDDLDRRDMLIRSTSSVMAGFLTFSTPNANADEEVSVTSTVKPMGTDPNHPIVVIGAGGKCGLLCTKQLAAQNLHVRAVTRTARSVLEETSDYVTYASGDVTDLASITNAVKDASGVIFAASASKKGGDAAHVDYLGVANTAKACIANQVPKLAIISSLAVTRPQSIGFKITNIFGRIMDYKVAGEVIVRDLYANQASSSYVIIRPGGLSDEPSEGPTKIATSQGDIFNGEISREDVSKTTIAALLSSNVKDATIELFNKKGYAKSVKEFPSGYDETKLLHVSGDSYDALLNDIYTDSQMTELFADVVSTYKGTKVESLDSL